MSLSSAPTIEALPASVTSSGKWGDASSALRPSCRWKETARAKGQAPSVLGGSWRLLCLHGTDPQQSGLCSPGLSIWFCVVSGREILKSGA